MAYILESKDPTYTVPSAPISGVAVTNPPVRNCQMVVNELGTAGQFA